MLICGKCRGKRRIGNLVCWVCRGRGYITLEPRAPVEKSDP